MGVSLLKRFGYGLNLDFAENTATFIQPVTTPTQTPAEKPKDVK